MHPAPNAVTVIENCCIAPPREVQDHSLPLTFLDIGWIASPPVERLVFYRNPISSDHFVQSVVPKLKSSLTQALHLFFPLSGRLVASYVPDSTCPPFIRYVAGDDSVSLTVAESTADFYSLVANHIRPAEQLHALVPKLPANAVTATDPSGLPLLALQVTLFPGTGFCIGISNLHAAGDGSSIFEFVRAWAFFARCQGDPEPPSHSPLPSFDRNVIEDPKELWASYIRTIESFLRKFLKSARELPKPTVTNKIRTTFVMDRDQIQKLKQAVLTKKPALEWVSTFTVVCGYVWSCIVKSRSSREDDQDEEEEFGFPGDCRGRSNPSIPTNYFGNCLTMLKTFAKVGQLTAEDGFITAADLIGEVIRKIMYGEEGLFKDAENRFKGGRRNWGRVTGVAGSTNFNYYDIDFGWGKAYKFEMVSIDVTGAISLSKHRDSEGGIEIGLSLPDVQMDAFISAFNDGLACL